MKSTLINKFKQIMSIALLNCMVTHELITKFIILTMRRFDTGSFYLLFIFGQKCYDVNNLVFRHAVF